jgi:hypothetical protein
MRQVMPHRNNIVVRRTKSKVFFRNRRLQEDNINGNRPKITNKLRINNSERTRYNHTKQWFVKTILFGAPQPRQRNGYGTYAIYA